MLASTLFLSGQQDLLSLETYVDLVDYFMFSHFLFRLADGFASGGHAAQGASPSR